MCRRTIVVILSGLFFFMVSTWPSTVQADPVTKKSLLKLLASGVSEEVIQAQVEKEGYAGPLSSSDLIELNDAGLSASFLLRLIRLSAPGSQKPPHKDSDRSQEPSASDKGRLAGRGVLILKNRTEFRLAIGISGNRIDLGPEDKWNGSDGLVAPGEDLSMELEVKDYQICWWNDKTCRLGSPIRKNKEILVYFFPGPAGTIDAVLHRDGAAVATVRMNVSSPGSVLGNKAENPIDPPNRKDELFGERATRIPVRVYFDPYGRYRYVHYDSSLMRPLVDPVTGIYPGSRRTSSLLKTIREEALILSRIHIPPSHHDYGHHRLHHYVPRHHVFGHHGTRHHSSSYHHANHAASSHHGYAHGAGHGGGHHGWRGHH